MDQGSSKQNAFVDVAAGVIGGVAGILAMEGYWKILSTVLGKDLREEESDLGSLRNAESGYGRGSSRDVSWSAESGEASWSAESREASRSAEQRSLSEAEMIGDHRSGSPASWGPGLMQAGVYGLLRGRAHGADLLGGSALGAALWLIADEIAPMMHATEDDGGNGSTGYTPAQHVGRLGARIAFGVTAAAVSRYVRDLILQLVPKRLLEESAAGFDHYGRRHYEFATDI